MDRITVKSVYVKHELLRLRVLFGHGLTKRWILRKWAISALCSHRFDPTIGDRFHQLSVIRSPPRSAAFVFLYSLYRWVCSLGNIESLSYCFLILPIVPTFFFHVISIFYNRFRRENMNVYYVKIVHARARDGRAKHFIFFFLFSRVLVLCGQLIASVVSPYKRDENKGPKQLVHEAIGTLFPFYAPRISHAF